MSILGSELTYGHLPLVKVEEVQLPSLILVYKAGSYKCLADKVFSLANRLITCQLNGALDCVMVCLTASPPLTVLSVITYLTPVSTSNSTPSKTSSTTDLSPLAPVPRSRAILAIS